MKYSLISLPDYRFGIFPPGAPETLLEENCDFEPILLLPSTKCDFEIKLRKGKEFDCFYTSYVLAALEFYFFEIRKLPLTEIEIAHSVLNFKLKNANKIVLKTPKCKYDFTKKRLEISGVSIDVIAVNQILIFYTENVSHFNENCLLSALIKEENYSAALSYSQDGNCVRVKKSGNVSVLESAVAISELMASSGEIKRGGELDFFFDSGQKLTLKNLAKSLFEISLMSEFLGFFEYV